MVRRIVKNISISRHLLQFLESGWGGGGCDEEGIGRSFWNSFAESQGQDVGSIM